MVTVENDVIDIKGNNSIIVFNSVVYYFFNVHFIGFIYTYTLMITTLLKLPRLFTNGYVNIVFFMSFCSMKT